MSFGKGVWNTTGKQPGQDDWGWVFDVELEGIPLVLGQVPFHFLGLWESPFARKIR